MSLPKTVKKCLFPVAGYGTRFLPATKSMPKEMLPIVNKPLIQYAAEEAMEAGVTKMGFITGRGKRAIADYFDNNYELEHEIAGSKKAENLNDINNVMDSGQFIFMRQREMLGLGHAILTGEPIIGNEPFAVILADDLCVAPRDGSDTPRAMAQLIELYNQYQCCIVAIEEVPKSDTGSYGIISGEEIEPGIYDVSDMIEKPKPEDAPTNMAIIGRYVLTPQIFDYLRQTKPGANGEVQITDALKQVAREERVIAVKFAGQRFDCGSIPGFVEATNYFYEHEFKAQ
ncbi:UTP--glucose-1-phosphate uridylyltransferase GalU [Bermanella sp. WJH001]|uniref:UTP--glucose-1-phosphate uridylyltransferase GalU n=1 Tax=Bermanella sp. WJH001 TaxID=3048005 RepID=UPI0024BEC242|nr:UTP--glucose-1-phosphate uridylyltransferase GalU [Bermanella sp. WJH001]MDJ1537735.1 UTP--glucose-1-phosphate uridylyltransferase GalU [Bermanella sp. WJH001]